MATKKRWTNEENKILLKEIEKSPQNLKKAFENAGNLLEGRTAHSCERHWYLSLAKKEDVNLCFATVGRKSLSKNRKVVRKNSPKAGTVKVTAPWWRKFLQLLHIV